jgi:signal transduction histidine kinase
MTVEKNIILLVDDSRSVRSQIGSILETAGYQIITAVDGKDGLNKLGENEVDLIISDLEMPVLDGLGFCRAVKGDPRLRGIYFIMLSARSETETRVRGRDTGADDYIVKTTHMDEFLARVRGGLRIRRLERELNIAQAHLFHTEKMASLGQLSAGLAHEINNPIGFIISNLTSLDRYLARLVEFIDNQAAVLAKGENSAAELDSLAEQRRRLKIDHILEDGKELIAESREGAERISRIVGNLRNFMDVDSYQSRPTDLNESLEQAIQIMLLEFKELRPPRRDFADIPLTRCNALQFNQVFANILRNAAQAAAAETEICVTTRSKDGKIILSIADSGCGIPAEILKRIFDPFFTTRTVGQGAGLGLTSARDIVSKHGGTISVESQVDVGTTVRIELPVQS